MARLNQAQRAARARTHEGAPARRITPEQSLERSVLACLLWEKGFYEDGVDIAERISNGVSAVSGEFAQNLAIKARTGFKLRHVPLLIANAMTRHHAPFVRHTLAEIIQRPDELSEFLAIYWQGTGRRPVASQAKLGLAQAFRKFNEYQLAKYNRNTDITLRDVLFLCHAKPENTEQQQMWERMMNGELASPETWENRLSRGEDKKETFESMIRAGELGALALLRNLRNMQEAGVDEELVKGALAEMNVERILPFRFITAAKHNPHLEADLEQAMFRALAGMEKFSGKTILLIDVSGSMSWGKLGRKGEMTCLDAACALSILARELCHNVEIFTFSNKTVPVPNRRGFALRDAIITSQLHQGTMLGQSVREIAGRDHDRLIVFTDEQSHDPVGRPRSGAKSYMVNVATNQHGVGYGEWLHLDGFSEAIMRYIYEMEQTEGGTHE